MKKNFLLALLGIVAMLTSCNKEEVGGLATNKATSFNVSVEGEVKTRGNEVNDLTRYVMEVYKGATATGTPEIHQEQTSGIFTDVLLDNAQQYTVLFWADYGTPSTDNATNEYNAADLKAAQVAANKQPTQAAYSGVSKFTVGTTDESVYTNVALTHAVAQVSFVQTEVFTSDTNELVVNYPESYSLNVGDNTVTKINGAITHSFTYNKKETGTLGTSYIIAATGATKTVLELTATLNRETAIAVSNVPFERNFKTNISGAYSSKYDAALTVTCDDTWGTPDSDVLIPDYAIGALYPNATNPIGVVFWNDPTDASKGKIVSLDEATYTQWSTESINTDATSDTDGASNTAKVLALASYTAEKYPAFAWCATKKASTPSGISWYLPAKEELRALYTAYNGDATTTANATARTAFNDKLTTAGGTVISDNWYCSSTQGNEGSAWYVYFDGGVTGGGYKDSRYGVRVVSAF